MSKTKTKARTVTAGYGRVLVTEVEGMEGQSEGGIYLPGGHDKLARGRVVSVGFPDEKYGWRECPISVGDMVMFAPFRVSKTPGGKDHPVSLTRDVLVDGQRYVAVLQAEVIGIVSP